jgi:hypothetical protein
MDDAGRISIARALALWATVGAIFWLAVIEIIHLV